MTDPILAAIDNAVRDYGISDDAMRWTPETPEPAHSTPPAPAPRIELVEIRVKTSDGEEITYTMQGAEEVTVSMEWPEPAIDPWDAFEPYRLAVPRPLESFTLEASYPRQMTETRRAR